MGNRATVHLKNDTIDRGVYVHWNGGRGSIAAFLEETKKRMSGECLGDEDQTINAFYSTFFSVCREYFSYCNSYKSRTIRNVYYITEEASFMSEDNGCYMVEADYTCSRTDIDKLPPKEAEDYQTISRFFEAAHNAMSVVIDHEKICYTDKSTTEDRKAALIIAEELALNAANRVERLKAMIAEAEQLEAVTV